VLRGSWLLTALALGCGKPAPSAGVAASSAPPVASAAAYVLGAAELSSPTAFDLAARPDGLRLLWASADRAAGWLSEVELGHDAKPRGPARHLPVPARTLGKLTDLDASFAAGQLALAWLEQGSQEARAGATLLEGAATPVLLDLGAAALVAESARGNIAIAGQPERARALAMWRGLESPCAAPSTAPCTDVTFKHVRTGAAEPTGLPLSVPVPCTSHSVTLTTSPGRFYYGVCTRQGTDPVTTLFSIQYDPEYARAEPLLKGCLPLGTIQVAERPWLVGDCHGQRRAVPIPVQDEKPEVENIDALDLYCTPQRAELRQGRFKLVLSEPRADLQAILPAALLPSGARAGWSGSSLVVVYTNGPRLETRSLGCHTGKLGR
jgi:hypothetical protein